MCTRLARTLSSLLLGVLALPACGDGTNARDRQDYEIQLASQNVTSTAEGTIIALSFLVLDSGAPVPDAYLEWQATGGVPDGDRRSDPEGRFSIGWILPGNLADGPYSFQACASDEPGCLPVSVYTYVIGP